MSACNQWDGSERISYWVIMLYSARTADQHLSRRSQSPPTYLSQWCTQTGGATVPGLAASIAG
jgi:hypothetical protein